MQSARRKTRHRRSCADRPRGRGVPHPTLAAIGHWQRPEPPALREPSAVPGLRRGSLDLAAVIRCRDAHTGGRRRSAPSPCCWSRPAGPRWMRRPPRAACATERYPGGDEERAGLRAHRHRQRAEAAAEVLLELVREAEAADPSDDRSSWATGRWYEAFLARDRPPPARGAPLYVRRPYGGRPGPRDRNTAGGRGGGRPEGPWCRGGRQTCGSSWARGAAGSPTTYSYDDTLSRPTLAGDAEAAHPRTGSSTLRRPPLVRRGRGPARPADKRRPRRPVRV